MRSLRTLMLTLIPVVAVGACTTLSDKDRALLTAASQNAEQAKEQSAQALAAAQAAQASAAQAAADAKAADEKADRIFQRSLRK
jgi:Alanine-zipper, major outer membrane lipoprotein